MAEGIFIIVVIYSIDKLYYSSMIRLTKYNFIITTLALVLVVCCLMLVDNSTVDVSASDSTRIRVTVVDVLDGSVVHNATVDISGSAEFFTDNTGLSPTIDVPIVANMYDSTITDWYCVDVVVAKSGYVPTIVVGCVLYTNQLRQLTVYLYQLDSDSPQYVCYVESPPSDYLLSLVGQ